LFVGAAAAECCQDQQASEVEAAHGPRIANQRAAPVRYDTGKMSRRRSRTELAYSPIPFGLGETKPHHFRDMARIVWTNRDNLGYAWRVLTQGVCDGCALGTTGLHDWTIEG